MEKVTKEAALRYYTKGRMDQESTNPQIISADIQAIQRRQFLKRVAATGGAIIGTTILPENGSNLSYK